MSTFYIRPINHGDHVWVSSVLQENWGSARMVTKGKLFDADRLPGFIAAQGSKPVGLISYLISGDECEVGSLNSLIEGVGIGTALVDAVKEFSMRAGCRRLWLITTNDNLPALHFFQKRGFVLVEVYPNAIEQSRKLKPEIPLVGNDEIPIRDEIELELKL